MRRAAKSSPTVHLLPPDGTMIVSFKDEGTRDIWFGTDTRQARKTCPQHLWSRAAEKLDRLNEAEAREDLLVPRGSRLERLKGDRRGTYSIRINDRYRICFAWEADGPSDVEIVDYH